MATGIVLSIGNPATGDPNPTIGKVQVDETNEILNYQDMNFPNTGLALNSHCTFSISENPRFPGTYYATNLGSIIFSAPVTITTPTAGDLTANVGDVITISTAKAVITNGTVNVNGGKVIVDNHAVINCPVNIIGDGVFVARNGGKVTGNLNISTGGNLKIINKGKVVGNINVQSGGMLILGDNSGLGLIDGAVNMIATRGVAISDQSRINAQDPGA